MKIVTQDAKVSKLVDVAEDAQHRAIALNQITTNHTLTILMLYQ